ncbi:MAG: YifB family Mg chelatase-like AAA ATPase [Treponema sp.]|jgi:magnesium chelatase family protein|nr:YifB family Mg chelatase-like AAA ATPase [Treponema sp.]
MYITGYAPYGADGILVRVETDIRRGIPGIDISGLAEGAVREARERVRAAFRNTGLAFPLDRILINLAPAGVKKDGAALDLPIALSVMAAAGLIPGLSALPEQLMVLGELELSGRVRPVRGVLAAAARGLEEGIRFFIVPRENGEEAAVLLGKTGPREQPGPIGQPGRAQYCAVSSLDEAAHVLVLLSTEGAFPGPFRTGSRRCAAADSGARTDGAALDGMAADEAAGDGMATDEAGDFADVRGQGRYKRALEIAAAGGHNLLVFGAPGAGKTMLARRLPSIMAPLTPEESVEAARIRSLAGRLADGAFGRSFSLITRPPFRAPHHSASAEGILGGGRTVQPGEISLAHLGVLFLDEAPEFKSNVLQALREPLEDRFLTIVRAEGPVRLPADFQLVMAANSCPCGRLGTGGCYCSPEETYRYWRKFGGALLDRIEIRVPVDGTNGDLYTAPAKSAEGTGSPAGAPRGESSAVVRGRVIRAVEIQRRRFGSGSEFGPGSGFGPARKGQMPCRRNARMNPAQIEAHCALGGEAGRVFHRAAEKLGLSGRACHGVLKTARTIADLEGREAIETPHLLEAIQHRRTGDDPYDVLSLAGDRSYL